MWNDLTLFPTLSWVISSEHRQSSRQLECIILLCLSLANLSWFCCCLSLCLCVVDLNGQGVSVIDFSPANNLLVTGSRDCIIRGWNPYDREHPVMVLRGHEAPIIFLRVNEVKVCISQLLWLRINKDVTKVSQAVHRHLRWNMLLLKKLWKVHTRGRPQPPQGLQSWTHSSQNENSF